MGKVTGQPGEFANRNYLALNRELNTSNYRIYELRKEVRSLKFRLRVTLAVFGAFILYLLVK